jgi:hypothetical protein
VSDPQYSDAHRTALALERIADAIERFVDVALEPQAILTHDEPFVHPRLGISALRERWDPKKLPPNESPPKAPR